MTLSIIQRIAKLDATVAIANTVAPANDSANDRGCKDSIDRISIRWPGGRMQTVESVGVDQILTITEPLPGDLA